MKRCAACGTDNLDDANFCDNCGGALEKAPGAAAQPFAMAGVSTGRAFLRSEVTGREYELLPGVESLVGRGDRARGLAPEVELDDGAALQQGVSRPHAKVVFREGDYYLIDLNSTNRTRINGTELEPQRPYGLKTGDHVELGQYRLTFILR